MLLETYYTALEDVITRIQELNNDINSTQEFQQISLDTTRNRMMFLELRIAIAMFSLGVGTLIAGLFGMNLLSKWEEHPTACTCEKLFQKCENIFLLITIFYSLFCEFYNNNGHGWTLCCSC